MPTCAVAYEYWQFWRNTEDGDVGRFLRLFTDLPEDEIARLERLQGAELNEAKKVLATEATAMLHGRTAAHDAAQTARRTFEEGAMAHGLPTISARFATRNFEPRRGGGAGCVQFGSSQSDCQ